MKNFGSYRHLIEIDEAQRRLTIYRVFEDGSRELHSYTDLPSKTVTEDPAAFEQFALLLGENILLDLPGSRRLLFDY